MTAAETILVALTKLAGGHGEEASFPEEEVVLAAWREDRERFGLRGYRDAYPDTKRVTSELSCGKRSGLAAQGFIRRVAPLLWKLTAEGARFGAILLRRQKTEAASAA